MTTLQLLEELEKFVKVSTEDIILPVRGQPDLKERAPEIWKMRLPTKQAEIQAVPYIILQLINGKDDQAEGEGESSSCNIRMIVGCYSENNSEGNLQVLRVIDRLRIELLKSRVIGRRFVLLPPLEFIVYPDNTAPYFFGELYTTWSMPTITREVLDVCRN